MSLRILTILCVGYSLINAGDVEIFDIDDMLNFKYMPASFLMLDGHDLPVGLESPREIQNRSFSEAVTNGSFFGAINTMGFHRQMINEYLCRKYLAEQILKDLSPLRLNRRSGEPFHDIDANPSIERVSSPGPSMKENMLYDPGSSSYKDWLSRTTTLDDIYKHYGLHKNRKFEMDPEESNVDEEVNMADITGYAVQDVHDIPGVKTMVHMNMNKPKSGYGGAQYPQYPQYPPMSAEMPSHTAGGYANEANNYSPSYGQPAASHEVYHQEVMPYIHYHHDESSKKELLLKKLYHIALITLALLSFKVFAVQVVLCIAATKKHAVTEMPVMMMMTEMAMEETAPAETAPGVDEPPTAEGDETTATFFTRLKREASFHEQTENAQVNLIAQRALVTMEATVTAGFDSGVCLRREICRLNKLSRRASGLKRIWMPFLSLGLSWLSGKVVNGLTSSASILESLKAAALGLGGGDCFVLYKRCNLRKNREKQWTGFGID